MPCIHLTQLIQLCEQSQVRLSSSDLIHIVCKQCEKQEVCPSALLDDYEPDSGKQIEREVTSPQPEPPAAEGKS
jgi:hypothetical protein